MTPDTEYEEARDAFIVHIGEQDERIADLEVGLEKCWRMASLYLSTKAHEPADAKRLAQSVCWVAEQLEAP